MINAFTSNPKTSIFGILTITAEVLRANPSLISFLPDNVEGYILGLASVTFAILTAISARDKETPAQLEVKELKREVEKQALKEEIKEEAKVIAVDLAAKTAETVALTAIITKEEQEKAQALPLNVKEIIADSITTTQINTPNV